MLLLKDVITEVKIKAPEIKYTKSDFIEAVRYRFAEERSSYTEKLGWNVSIKTIKGTKVHI